ncbi:MAG: rRNA maturation RNase YbeY [Anaerolineae bacterium]|nr:rRNA maturation RNase YbeY [Anaerolineae bacterium]
MPILVDIQVAPHYEPLIDQARLRQAVSATLERQGWRNDGEVVLVITDDEGIRRLNLEFRGTDSATDVLAFSGALGEGFVTPEGYSGYLGDVVISYSRAEAQAAEAGHPVERELQLLTIHGVLHLTGLDDSDEAGWQEMDAIQKDILGSLAP